MAKSFNLLNITYFSIGKIQNIYKKRTKIIVYLFVLYFVLNQWNLSMKFSWTLKFYKKKEFGKILLLTSKDNDS